MAAIGSTFPPSGDVHSGAAPRFCGLNLNDDAARRVIGFADDAHVHAHSFSLRRHVVHRNSLSVSRPISRKLSCAGSCAACGRSVEI